jgi:hypothetical protein
MTEEQRQHRQDQIPDQIQLMREWQWKFNFWYGAHYAIGIAAVFLSTLVAAQPHLLVRAISNDVQPDVWKFIAFLSALATALVTFLSPQMRADRFREAWSILNATVTRFLADQTYTVDHVIQACKTGEAILHSKSHFSAENGDMPPTKGSSGAAGRAQRPR